MSLRIRQIKGDWWLDKALQTRLTADQREFYVGLWMVADDEGWIDWDPVRIGAELYPFRTPARRERQIVEWAEILEKLDPKAPHLVRKPCGHAVVPKMSGHQRLAADAKRVRSVFKKHLECPRVPAGTSGVAENDEPADPRVSPPLSTLVGNGKERNGNRARSPEGAAARGAMGEALLAAGLRPEIITGGKAS